MCEKLNGYSKIFSSVTQNQNVAFSTFTHLAKSFLLPIFSQLNSLSLRRIFSLWWLQQIYPIKSWITLCLYMLLEK